ncbi:hypothetical protein VTN31DRAFT_4516 [Thermomyces dupontii]|uniref:uncharacterized protein n=1 Tax=Talaromyces thermophilus TaxID=28565 RepID=UPI003743A8CF
MANQTATKGSGTQNPVPETFDTPKAGATTKAQTDFEWFYDEAVPESISHTGSHSKGTIKLKLRIKSLVLLTHLENGVKANVYLETKNRLHIKGFKPQGTDWEDDKQLVEAGKEVYVWCTSPDQPLCKNERRSGLPRGDSFIQINDIAVPRPEMNCLYLVKGRIKFWNLADELPLPSFGIISLALEVHPAGNLSSCGPSQLLMYG